MGQIGLICLINHNKDIKECCLIQVFHITANWANKANGANNVGETKKPWGRFLTAF